jgi:hypothetical protein
MPVIPSTPEEEEEIGGGDRRIKAQRPAGTKLA